jgi:integrase
LVTFHAAAIDVPRNAAISATPTSSAVTRARNAAYANRLRNHRGSGMRRGEVCGLPWLEVSLDKARLQVGAGRVQAGRDVATLRPKSAASERDVALDAGLVMSIRGWSILTKKEQLEWGSDYVDSGLVVVRENGEPPPHPDTLTDTCERLAFGAGLPPIGLHGLRHCHASYALAGGVDVKVVQDRLGRSDEQADSEHLHEGARRDRPGGGRPRSAGHPEGRRRDVR